MKTWTLDLSGFGDAAPSGEEVVGGLLRLRDATVPRLRRWMGYYRNAMTELSEVLPAGRSATLGVRPYRQYQEVGLPARITGFRLTGDGVPVVAGSLESQRKEVVIENDIAWRINTLVDFAVGQMPVIASTAGDAAKRAAITAALQAVLSGSGGLALLQRLTLLGAVHGAAYIVVKPSEGLAASMARRKGRDGSGGAEGADVGMTTGETPDLAGPETKDGALAAAAGMMPGHGAVLRLEVVEATGVLPMSWGGQGALVAIVRDMRDEATPGAGESALRKVARWLRGENGDVRVPAWDFELWSATRWQRYERGQLAAEGENPLGFVPVVAYVNDVAPSAGMEAPGLGMSEVEPLVGLQDELNTRLSDRASRVTMQSFRMYLARGIEDFLSRPVGPGQMWATDNPEATIESFGGDAASPSEDRHINEVREALDKISGVPPVAAGLLRDRVGNLTSAVALRLTMISLLARTQKRRAALTEVIRELCRRVLEALDAGGVLATDADQREVEVNWPSALPENAQEKLEEARLKVELGVKRSVVLAELGYTGDELAQQ